MAALTSFLLVSIGATVLVVWPEDGPSAWIRERLLRRLFPAAVKPVLDCYVCFSFWAGLVLSPIWWWNYSEPWTWFGCLMPPAVFWLVLDRNTPRN